MVKVLFLQRKNNHYIEPFAPIFGVVAQNDEDQGIPA
jgi:hypothetical protein